jgi:hypothetical protein
MEPDMRPLMVLAWWLFLFASLQVAALLLDGFHHLEWGRLGVHAIKACYVAFAAVLYFRYQSFRSQKSFETMVESYNRVSEKAFRADKKGDRKWVNPFLLLILLMISILDFAMVFRWNEVVFSTSVWLDFLIWMLTLRWLGRTYWLKAKGTRERLKEVLDDSRSLHGGRVPEPDALERKVSKLPFAALSSATLILALGVTAWRWNSSGRVYRIDDLKACMESSLQRASMLFHKEGRMGFPLPAEPCMLARRGLVEMSLDLHGGELLMRAAESDTVDYFGNGIRGDEGLVLGGNGRFRRGWSADFRERE